MSVSINGLLQGVRLEAYTVATLPAVGAAGRIVRVTDGARGLWMDTGTQWVALNGEAANVQDFDAVGDGSADDRGAFVNAAAAASTVLVPPGTYRIASNWTLGSGATLRLMRGATLKPASGVTVTFNVAAPPEAGEYQIFDLSAGGSFSLPAMEVKLEWFGAVGDGSTDDTTAINNASTSAGIGGALTMRAATYIVSNVVLAHAAQTLQGVDKQVSILKGKAGSTGIMLTDGGSAAKITLRNMALYGNSQAYTAGLKLGYNTTVWGSEGQINHVWVRDITAVGASGVDLKVNIANIQDLAIWNCTTNLRTIGTGLFVTGLVITNPTEYGIHSTTTASAFTQIEIESPATGAVPIYLARQATVKDGLISLSNAGATSFDYLVDLDSVNTSDYMIQSVRVIANLATVTAFLRHGDLTFGKSSPYVEPVISYDRQTPQVVVVNDAYAAARSTPYTVGVISNHPPMSFAMQNDLTANVTFDFQNTVGNSQGKRYRIANNSASKTGFIKGASSFYLRSTVSGGLVNSSNSVGVPVRPGAFAEWEYAGQGSSVNAIGIVTPPEMNLAAIVQGKYWQGEVIVQQSSLVNATNQYLQKVITTGYKVKGSWTTGTAYVVGDYVVNGANIYIATSAGTSGANAPVHTSGTVSDGAVDWLFVEAAVVVALKTVAVS